MTELNHLNAIRDISSLSLQHFPKNGIEMLKLEKYGRVLLDSLRDKGFDVNFEVRDLTNREVSMELVSGKFKEFCKDYRAYCNAYYYSRELLREIA